MNVGQESPRKICVVTGTRAEYGLLRGLMERLQADVGIELQIVVTGAHLSNQLGNTWLEIQRDGFSISAKVDMLFSSDTPLAIAKSVGVGTIGLADALDRMKPDLIVLLGDRYEIFCAAQVAMVLRIPIAHIHGGETTLGVIDEAIRHSLSKMSHLHFVAAEDYRRRVIQLGENPSRVFNVGGLGLDSINELVPMTRAELEAELGMQLKEPLMLVTCHPETLNDNSEELVGQLVAALTAFPSAMFVITGTNADPSGRTIEHSLNAFADRYDDRARCFANLGQTRYLNLMREADVVVGNSSSGVLEAPALGTPSVNIGTRQQGRLRAPSVIDCNGEVSEICSSIVRALTPEFKAVAARKETPYGKQGASDRIAQELRTVNLDNIMLKHFNDLDFQYDQ